jgi:hypothetical protein
MDELELYVDGGNRAAPGGTYLPDGQLERVAEVILDLHVRLLRPHCDVETVGKAAQMSRRGQRAPSSHRGEVGSKHVRRDK